MNLTLITTEIGNHSTLIPSQQVAGISLHVHFIDRASFQVENFFIATLNEYFPLFVLCNLLKSYQSANIGTGASRWKLVQTRVC